MTISIIFSIAIYNIASNEVNDRLGQLQTKIERAADDLPFDVPLPDRLQYATLRNAQFEAANHNLMVQLIYANFLIFIVGGAGGHFLARRTLRPIEETHEAQARFVSDASHELKTPLSVMKTEIEVALRDKNLPTDEARELLISNLEEVNKLTNLSTTLLQLSQLDHANLEKDDLSLNKLTQNIVQKYDKSGKRIAFTPTKKRSFVHGNQACMEELITILIDNALKYSPDDSLVTIKTRRLKKSIDFTIINTGPGIKADDLPHIFDRFYRADTARTKNNTVNGHGLGLSLAKRIIQLHDGELSASSAPDHATTFSFRLPTIPSKS